VLIAGHGVDGGKGGAGEKAGLVGALGRGRHTGPGREWRDRRGGLGADRHLKGLGAASARSIQLESGSSSALVINLYSSPSFLPGIRAVVISSL
jgi:hypothetical protein